MKASQDLVDPQGERAQCSFRAPLARGSSGMSTKALPYSPAHPPAHGAVPWAGRQGADLPSGATHYPGVIPDNSLGNSCIFQTNITNEHCSENIFND